VITQKHTLQGTETVHVNAHALRIDSFSGVSIITTAPNWDIYICDFKRKTAYKTTTQAYENELFQTLEAFCEESPRKVAMEKIGKGDCFWAPLVLTGDRLMVWRKKEEDFSSKDS